MTLIRPPTAAKPLDRAFALEAVRITEAAAIAAAAHQLGRRERRRLGDAHGLERQVAIHLARVIRL